MASFKCATKWSEEKTSYKLINKLKDPEINNSIVNYPSRIPNIINKYFSCVGNNLATKMPQAEHSNMDYLSNSKSSDTVTSSVSLGAYPSNLKMSKIMPIFKADDETDARNYGPISLLSNFNRIFEKIMYNKMKVFIENTSSYRLPNTVFVKHTQLNMLYLTWN